jgi:hypothetical protein
MSLPAEEFLQRFLLHVVPSGFRRIRHFGLLAKDTRFSSTRFIRYPAGGRLCHSTYDSGAGQRIKRSGLSAIVIAARNVSIRADRDDYEHEHGI